MKTIIVPVQSATTYKGHPIVNIRKRKPSCGNSLIKSLLRGKKADWRSAMISA